MELKLVFSDFLDKYLMFSNHGSAIHYLLIDFNCLRQIIIFNDHRQRTMYHLIGPEGCSPLDHPLIFNILIWATPEVIGSIAKHSIHLVQMNTLRRRSKHESQLNFSFWKSIINASCTSFSLVGMGSRGQFFLPLMVIMEWNLKKSFLLWKAKMRAAFLCYLL